MFCSGVASAPSLLGPKVRGSVSGRKVVGWLEEKGEGSRGTEGRRGGLDRARRLSLLSAS